MRAPDEFEYQQLQIGRKPQLVQVLVQARQSHIDAEHRSRRPPRCARQRDAGLRHIGEPIGWREDRVGCGEGRPVPGPLARIESRRLRWDPAQFAAVPINHDPAGGLPLVGILDQHEYVGSRCGKIGAYFRRPAVIEALDHHMRAVGASNEDAHGGGKHLIEIFEDGRQHLCQVLKRQIAVDRQGRCIEHRSRDPEAAGKFSTDIVGDPLKILLGVLERQGRQLRMVVADQRGGDRQHDEREHEGDQALERPEEGFRRIAAHPLPPMRIRLSNRQPRMSPRRRFSVPRHRRISEESGSVRSTGGLSRSQWPRGRFRPGVRPPHDRLHRSARLAEHRDRAHR